MNIGRYLNTVRYLKLNQILSRIKHSFCNCKPKIGPPPHRRTVNRDPWTAPIEKPQTLIEPWVFRFFNQERELFDWNDKQFEKLWLYNLHYFDDLVAEKAAGRHDWHRELILKWIDENPPGSGNGWEPYPTSRRLVNWIKWVLDGNNPTEEMIQSLAVQTRWLMSNLEFHLLGNHLFANAKALVFAGLHFEGEEAKGWLVKGLSILESELAEQILQDGGHFERSPMYHSLVLEDILDLINITQTFAQTPPSAWIDAAKKMLMWLAGMIHPDGEIALFNDAAFGIAPHPNDIFSYANRLGINKDVDIKEGLTNFQQTGYLRLQKGPAVAFLDVAPIGPDYLPGHAHADTLNFELSLFGHRVIVDSGTSLYGTNAERLRQRGTAAHNTVIIDGKDSSEVWSGFRVARRARPSDLIIEETANMIKVACSHDGYKRLSGRPVHRRQWQLTDGYLQISDSIHGRFQKAVGRFHFHPDVYLDAEESTLRGKITLPTRHKFRWEVLKGQVALRNSTYHPEFGLCIDNQCLEIELDGGESHIVFRWD